MGKTGRAITEAEQRKDDWGYNKRFDPFGGLLTLVRRAPSALWDQLRNNHDEKRSISATYVWCGVSAVSPLLANP
jgi:hypothetical protein